MIISRPSRFSLLRLVFMLLSSLVVGSLGELAAQSLPTPSADQLDMLRNLSPDQRDALKQQMGIQGGSAGATSRSQRNSQAAPADEDPTAVQRDRLLQEEINKRLQDELHPVLKAEDTVLIAIEYSPDTLKRLGNTGAALPSNLPPSQYSQPANTAFQLPGANVGTAVLGNQGNPSQSVAPWPTGNGQLQSELPLTESERHDLDRLIEQVRSANPYRLDREGALELPGFPSIPLTGLSDDQATMRLQAEPALHLVNIKVTRLPLERTGQEGLKPFGYDLFDTAPSTFAPMTNVPVPADYLVGPGDELDVELYGSENRTLTLTVGRDGGISIPELGPINVGGQRFDAVKSSIESRVARQLIGVHADVSMGDLRSIRVFVLGEAKFPGTYTVSSLATITSALFACGGVKPIGSLRDVQLKRQGVTIRHLDLYDLLIRGNTVDDAQLHPGDVVFIPPIGVTASVAGEVRRPAIYEMKTDTRASDLVELAGGLTPDADSARVSLSRVDVSRRRVVMQIDLGTGEGRDQRIDNGDALRVARLRPQLDSGVELNGYVYRPGVFAWHKGMVLTDVLPSVDEVKPNGDLGYVLIRRELPPDRRIAVLSADLATALREPQSRANVTLMPRDRIIVFDLASTREFVIHPVLEELKLQGGIDHPEELVRVEGSVKVPGEYPLEPHMRVSDLVRAGGNLSDSAYGGKAELTRYIVDSSGSRETEFIEVDLAAVRRGDVNADVELRPYDYLNIKEVPAWGKLEQVSIRGEVKFPGVYPIRRGETLSGLLKRAGGFTDLAFTQGSVFTRKELREREQQQLDTLEVRLQKDFTILALRGAAANQQQAGTALQVGSSLLSQLQSAKAVGRLVINLDRVVAGPAHSEQDISLRDGDELLVPKQRQEVTVIGEVPNSTSLFYRRELTRDDYIRLSGGVTREADKRKIYVVRADGSIVENGGNRWFDSGGVEIRPGDTIVVPLDTERLPALPLWQAVTQILYNTAVAVAAVHSL